jgi:predicted RNA-binding Zn ribbon-like protein
MLMVEPDHQALVAQVHRLIEDGGGFVVAPEWTSNDDVPVWRAEVRTLAAALGVALWNTLRTSPGVAICANCLRLFETRQRNQRYCDKSVCQTERKRVEKVQLRARQAAATTPDPEYTI